MKFGLMFTNTGMGSSATGALDLATRADRLGFESLWTVEHVVVPSGYQSAYPYDPSGKMAGGAEEFDLPDPLMWLAFVASATQRIRLATGVLIVPQRNPLILAKEVATLDMLSGGRVTLGVGVGWLEEEFNALGVPFADRGRRLDDYIEAMRALWTQQKASVHNTYAAFEDCISLPHPPNGTVPIVVGGHSKAAARRAARLGDGFFPGNGSVAEVTEVFATFHAACVELGRDPKEVELTAGSFGRSFDHLASRIEQLAALGVSRAILSPLPGDQLDELAASLQDRFGMEP
jgi:probable F420-dependent oxidoreductase